MTTTKPSRRRAGKSGPAFTDDERAAMRERARELKTSTGFRDKAQLDDGAMWPTAFALKARSAAEEVRIAALVRQAAGSLEIRSG